MAPQPAPNDALSENRFVADKLYEMARLLDQQKASLFRVRAYRDAANNLRGLPHPVRPDDQRGGKRGPDDLPALGQSIAATINLIRPRRVESLRRSLADMLARRRPRQAPTDRQQPSVADILAVDRICRSNVDRRPNIKPRRFNPGEDAVLPILHTEKNGWQFTALFSSSPTADRFAQTRDWVLICFERADQPERQVTVVTEHGGRLDGKRVIRGQENACAAHYEMSQKQHVKQP